ncbi:MAG: NADH-quinone oxidoreductase subunit NuoE [Deltaproteobacteria bacterium HGW-Deltaproteobacteria-17]|nr:MAG: NADH-quinone oxidoreductase subunit NuoE [Deltaproteobacteria bacterium HGW-Deltaproteobacteria-17]
MNNVELIELVSRTPDGDPSQLISLLQKVQEEAGFLSREAIDAIAGHLRLSPAAVYGVASFYNQFRFNAPGRLHLQVCRGTACHVKGSLDVLETLQRELKILPGQTTRDGAYSLETVACVGACSLAPVVVAGGEFHAGMDSEKTKNLLVNMEQVTGCNA